MSFKHSCAGKSGGVVKCLLLVFVLSVWVNPVLWDLNQLVL